MPARKSLEEAISCTQPRVLMPAEKLQAEQAAAWLC